MSLWYQDISDTYLDFLDQLLEISPKDSAIMA
jgi:hypothetical protein